MIRQLHAQEAQQLLQNPTQNTLLLDVREPWEYNIAHLPNSLLIPMRQIPEKMQQLDPEQEIVVLCHHGIRSMQVARYLVQNGFQSIINLTGGISAWSKEVDASIPQY